VGAPFGVAPVFGVAGRFVAGGAEELEIAEADALGRGCCGCSPAGLARPAHPESVRAPAVRAIALIKRTGPRAVCLNAANTPTPYRTVRPQESGPLPFYRTLDAAASDVVRHIDGLIGSRVGSPAT
jgi:hypothetical protein